MAATTEATAEVKAIFSVVDQASAPIQKITENLQGVAAAAKDVAADVPHSLAEVAQRAGVAWRPGDVVAPVTPAVTEQVTAAAGAIAPAVGDQISQATAAIDKVSGHWTHLKDAIDKVSDAIGSKVKATFQSIENVAGSVVSKIASAWEGLGGTLAAFGLGGLIEQGIEYAFHGMEKLVAEVEKLGPRAKAIGIPIAQLQDLNRWAEDAGVASDKLDRALVRLTQTLGEVQAGGNRKATDALDELGVSVTDSTGKLRSTVDVLPEVIDALNKITDPTKRAAEAAAIFKLQWSQIAPVMTATSDAINKARTEQEAIGHITEEQAKRAEAYAAAHKRMTDALNALQETIGSNLLPAMTPLLTEITSITEAFNHWAQSVEGAKGIEQTFKDIADFIHSTRTDIEAIEAAMKWIGDHLFSLKGAMPVAPEGAPNLATWTPGGILAPSAPSPGGGPLTFEQLAPPPLLGTPGGILAPSAPSPGGGPLTFEQLAPPPLLGAPAPGASVLPAPAAGTAPGAVPAAPPPSGTVNVNITHENPPPGTRLNVSTQGNGLKTTAQTGWSMPQIQAPWAPPPVQQQSPPPWAVPTP
jgi:hypothetical protein